MKTLFFVYRENYPGNNTLVSVGKTAREAEKQIQALKEKDKAFGSLNYSYYYEKFDNYYGITT